LLDDKGYISPLLTSQIALRQLEEFIVAAKVNREECVSCGTCVDECPEEAITLDDEEIATVNPEKCTECGKCVEACPSNAISLDK
jgi:ferredoxin